MIQDRFQLRALSLTPLENFSLCTGSISYYSGDGMSQMWGADEVVFGAAGSHPQPGSLGGWHLRAVVHFQPSDPQRCRGEPGTARWGASTGC